MKVIAAHSPVFSNAQQTAINLMVVFEGIGEVPFTASPDDVEPHGVELFQRAQALEFGPVAPYVAPPPVVPQIVTMRQARLALLGAGLLAQVGAAINALPEPDQTAARIEWEYSSEVHRDKPFVQMLGGALGLTGEQLDNLFTQAAQL